MPIAIPDRFLSAKEIASCLGCSARTVRRYMAAGRLPSAPRLSARQRWGCQATVLRARLDELERARKASNDNNEADEADAPNEPDDLEAS